MFIISILHDKKICVIGDILKKRLNRCNFIKVCKRTQIRCYPLKGIYVFCQKMKKKLQYAIVGQFGQIGMNSCPSYAIKK